MGRVGTKSGWFQRSLLLVTCAGLGCAEILDVDWGAYGVARLAGSTCEKGAECLSGHCADGVCCDTDCSGVCEACAASIKGSGKDGVCEAISAQTDPDSECDEGICAVGECDGQRACAKLPVGAACGGNPS